MGVLADTLWDDKSVVSVVDPGAGLSQGQRPMSEVSRKEPTISALVLRGLIHVLEETGVSRADLLRDENLEPLLGGDARIPYAEGARLCMRAMELTCDPALGLHWAEHLSQSTFGPISHLCTAAPTLRHALDVLSQYSQLFADEPFFELQESADVAIINVLGFEQQPLELHRFAAELTVGGFVRVVRSVWAGARFQSLNFRYPAPGYRDEYRRVFKQPASFGQPFTGLAFDRALLSAPSQYRDDALSATMGTLAQRRMEQVYPTAPYTLRVRERLEKKAPARVTMEAVAMELGMSARSLRRRLHEEKTTYIELEGEVLGAVAAQLLQDTSIKDVAYRMGFANAATFHRAFKRWRGTTPSVLQHRRRGRA